MKPKDTHKLNNDPPKIMVNAGPSLGERTIKGGFWVFSLRISNRLFRFVRTIILARLLAPNDFGLFGIALLALAFLDTFSQTGFWQALIQKRGDVKPYLNTAWTIGIIRSLVIAAILFSAAPLTASFFNESQAEPILKVIGLAIIFQSLTNIAVIYFDKELEFHKYFLYMFIGTIADMIVAITAALLLRSAWALVLGRLAGDLVRCGVSYLIHPYRPRPKLDVQKAKELFSFGKWILGQSILVFFITKGGDIVIGKFLGTIALGLYQLGYLISNITATEMTFPITKVTFPAYAKLQDNLPRLREVYLKVLQFTAFIIFPVAGLLFAVADNFTLTVLGEKWNPIIPIVRILIFQACSRAIRRTLDPLSKAVGHPEIVTKVTFIQLVILAILIYPATSFFGIPGVALAVVFQSLATLPIIIHRVIIKIDLGYRAFMKAIMFPFLSSSVMAGGIFVIQARLPFNMITLCIEIFLGLLFYLSINLIFNRGIFKEFSMFKRFELGQREMKYEE